MLSLSLLAAIAHSDYPESKRTDFKETLHGVEVADPYRWMEEMESAQVKDWVNRQNEFTRKHLDAIPGREAIQKRYTELYNFGKYGTPFKMGGRYFWTENTGLQNQDVWYWSNKPGKNKKLLLDPNTFSKDGTVALSGTSISWDGKYLTYSISRGGSDWQEWYVKDIASGKVLSDKIEWSKFSGASWSTDNQGFYYSRYDAPKQGQALAEANYYQRLYYHKVGSAQSKDKLIYERKDHKTWGFGGEVTEDGRYLILSVWEGTNRENRLFYKDLKAKSAKVVELIPSMEASYGFLGNVGSKLYFFTDLKAPMGKVIAIDTKKPSVKESILPETAEKLESVHMVGGKLVGNYLQDAHTVVKVFSLKGRQEATVPLPGIGAAEGFAGLKDDPETFYSYQSFGYPMTVFRYDVKSGKSTMLFQPKVKFKPENFETKQVFYASKDGTKVPLFLTYKKGMKLDGTNPALLYGYGGFNAGTTPFFSASRLLWMEMGGISAVACIRGGSEYGNKWHDGGRLKNKQNCFDDFIAAAEYLIDQKYSSTPKLAIQGGSNGGLLVGACMTQRPDLFGACLPEVGVMDMLRFHKFTIGWAWTSDYGSPDKKEDFEVALKYSPYHNARPASYPPTLVITGDHDDRVVPMHSFKFAAALQYAQQGDAPILIRIETQAGHGAGKPTSKIIEEITDKWVFLAGALKIIVPEKLGD